MTLLISCIVAWLVCAIITASIALGHFQGKYPRTEKENYRSDLSGAWFFGLFFGPVALVISFFLSGFCQYGLMNPFIWNKYKE